MHKQYINLLFDINMNNKYLNEYITIPMRQSQKAKINYKNNVYDHGLLATLIWLFVHASYTHT